MAWIPQLICLDLLLSMVKLFKQKCINIICSIYVNKSLDGDLLNCKILVSLKLGLDTKVVDQMLFELLNL